MKADIKYFEDFDEFLFNNKNSTSSYLLYVASKTLLDIKTLQGTKLKLYGAFFPQIIYNNKLYDEGVISFEIETNMEAVCINDIEHCTIKSEDFKNIESVITLLDGFSSFNESFLSKLYASVDLNTNIIGGGAGSIQDSLEGALFTNEGFVNNSAILIKLKIPIDIGVRHGWQYLKGPFLATKSEKNRLAQIDYKSALKVYSEVIEEDCGQKLTAENFLELAKNYPIGIVKYKGEQIVRDPIAFEDNSLVLVGEIKENSIINILTGEKEDLLKAAKSAADEAVKSDCRFIMLFDCVSRVGFLDTAFDDELKIISSNTHASTIMGAITIGEIANQGKKFIHFYNKTCVVGGICF